MYRGTEMVRIMSMLGLLAVLAMIMLRARDPNTWRWLASESAAEKAAPPAPPEPESPPPPKPEEQVSAGPTDEDPEQRTAAAEEFQAVTDGTLGVQQEEGYAYWRLLQWADHQSTQQLRERAERAPSLAELMQFPDRYRGRLLSLTLNVRRVLEYEMEDSLLETNHFYELWGFTEDSQAWLYVVVTAHLPEDLPIGPTVDEQVRVTGYFFKLQGYCEAGAKPRDRPLRAPLLVGRVSRWGPVPTPPAPTSPAWIWGGLAGVAILLGGAALAQRVAGRRAARRQAERHEHTRENVRQWLGRALDADEPPPSDRDDAWAGPAEDIAFGGGPKSHGAPPTGGNGHVRHPES